jgi:hypothetical protein
MTTFTKENLVNDGGYVTYLPMPNCSYDDRKFVARFKHARDGAGSFVTCLRKNFTVEEYFDLYDSGMSPLPIAQTKGYLLPHIKKWLKRDGYPVTTEGYKAWSDVQFARWNKV